MTIQIEEIEVPDCPDSRSWAIYAQHLAVRNRNEADVLGVAAPYVDPVESLPYFLDQELTEKRLYVALKEGSIVGQALYERSRFPEDRIAWIFGGVLANSRGQGVGTALFDRVERDAMAAGCVLLQSMVLHGPSGNDEMVPALSGIGCVPAADPGVRFVTRRGYQLEQVQRWSTLDLPFDRDRVSALRDRAASNAGSDYAVHSWTGPSPDRWLNDLAVLAAAMEQDVPHAGMHVETTQWDGDRVRRLEELELEGGRGALTTAVEHLPTGRLAGFTRYSLPSDVRHPVTQGATLVLEAHRGRQLGALLKSENLLRVERACSDSRLVLTVNAEENQHILAINERLGFRTAGYTGAWKKQVDRP